MNKAPSFTPQFPGSWSQEPPPEDDSPRRETGTEAKIVNRTRSSFKAPSLPTKPPSPPATPGITSPDTISKDTYRRSTRRFRRSPQTSLRSPAVGAERSASGGTPKEAMSEDASTVSDTNSLGFTAPGQLRMIVAIDYGTTFTGIGYMVHGEKIEVVSDWGPGMDNDVKVPSVISYSPRSEAKEQQFGASLSPDAVAMINTKLELDAQDTRLDELDLILQVLEGVKDLNFEHVRQAHGLPGYTWKAPEDIVKDYLEKAFAHFDRATEYLTEIKNSVPVDVIITVPVKWSYRAKNSTFRAVREAGFDERAFQQLERYIMVTEPEAAALYTARYLKEQEGEDLRAKDCFVLCDAGGGTVDTVAYKVKQTEPALELEQLTVPTGAKCGASFVDRAFRDWLYDVLGEENYGALDPRNDSERISAHATEGGKMRLLMQAFESHKKAFKGSSQEMRIDLPAPLHKLTIAEQGEEGEFLRVEEGELVITNDDMQFMFRDCVDDIIDLIQNQIAQVEQKRTRVKTIFLIGGFSESQFLQEELAYSLRLRDISLRRPSTSWSAVVRGAVLYGMESSSRTDQTRMIPCPRNYGLVLNHSYSKRLHGTKDIVTNEFTNQTIVKSQFDWFVLNGDLLLQDESREIERSVVFYFHENEAKVCTIRLYEYIGDRLPDRYETAHEEVKQVGILVADLSHMGNGEFERRQNPHTGLFFYEVPLTARFTIKGTTMTCELWWENTTMAKHVLERIDQITPYVAYQPSV